MKIRDGLNAFIKIEQAVFFVGAVQVIAVKPKTKEYCFAV